jgi:hypothetical protein
MSDLAVLDNTSSPKIASIFRFHSKSIKTRMGIL